MLKICSFIPLNHHGNTGQVRVTSKALVPLPLTTSQWCAVPFPNNSLPNSFIQIRVISDMKFLHIFQIYTQINKIFCYIICTYF